MVPHTATEQVVQSISDTETSQGVVGVLRKPSFEVGDVLQGLNRALLVAMDGVQDPGNAGRGSEQVMTAVAQNSGFLGLTLSNYSQAHWCEAARCLEQTQYLR